jgi:hypothetical protein
VGRKWLYTFVDMGVVGRRASLFSELSTPRLPSFLPRPCRVYLRLTRLPPRLNVELHLSSLELASSSTLSLPPLRRTFSQIRGGGMLSKTRTAALKDEKIRLQIKDVS